jgi:hypothetical protein
METALEKATELNKLGHIPQVLTQIKSGLELYYLVGLHMVDHPINGLAGMVQEIHELIIKAEAANEKWLITQRPESIPEGMRQQYMQAMAKHNAAPPTVSDVNSAQNEIAFPAPEAVQ